MRWDGTLDEINSSAFRASLSVVSSTDAFFKAVAQQPAVLNAQRLMLGSGELKEEMLGYIYDLVTEETDPNFLNPNDKPLATFLWLTAFAAPDYAETAAKWTDRAPRCWYAKHLAQRILNPPASITMDYKFGGKQDQVLPTEMWSRSMRFVMQPLAETSFRFHNIGLRQEPSSPAFANQKSEQVVSFSSEAMF